MFAKRNLGKEDSLFLNRDGERNPYLTLPLLYF